MGDSLIGAAANLSFKPPCGRSPFRPGHAICFAQTAPPVWRARDAAMTNDLSIFQKGLILVLIPLVCQALFLGVLAKIRIDQADAQQWTVHTHRVLADADHLSALLAESQNALRGFLITANPSY